MPEKYIQGPSSGSAYLLGGGLTNSASGNITVTCPSMEPVSKLGLVLPTCQSCSFAEA
jgi:hypothetical protein